MALEEFTWCPQTQSPGTTTLRTRTAQFGDGYKQVSGDGLNGKSQAWDLVFTGPESEIRAIRDFLDRHQGYRSFAWRPPLEDLGLYQAGEYKLQPLGARRYTLTATFTQAFHP